MTSFRFFRLLTLTAACLAACGGHEAAQGPTSILLEVRNGDGVARPDTVELEAVADDATDVDAATVSAQPSDEDAAAGPPATTVGTGEPAARVSYPVPRTGDVLGNLVVLPPPGARAVRIVATGRLRGLAVSSATGTVTVVPQRQVPLGLTLRALDTPDAGAMDGDSNPPPTPSPEDAATGDAEPAGTSDADGTARADAAASHDGRDAFADGGGPTPLRQQGGAPCASGGDCLSAECLGGVCCDHGCGGECWSCAASGPDPGACVPAPLGTACGAAAACRFGGAVLDIGACDDKGVCTRQMVDCRRNDKTCNAAARTCQ